MKEVVSNSFIDGENSTEGTNDVFGLLGDTDHRPRFNSDNRHTREVVNAFVEEVSEQVMNLPKDSLNLHFRFLLSDIAIQLAHSLDGLLNRNGTPADLRNLGVRVTTALVAAYQFAGIKPTVPSKTLTALSQAGKLMVKRCNSVS